MMNEIQLDGCNATPIASYCKSLGIFKILNKKDSTIRAYWKNDKFILVTNLTKKDILNFIINDYTPTPILGPWSYNKYNKVVEELKNTDNPKFDSYKNEVTKTNQIISGFFKFNGKNMCEYTIKERNDYLKNNKIDFLNLCRNELSDETVYWLDTAFALHGKRYDCGPILGSGGNDGNYNMSENFLSCLIKLFSNKYHHKYKEWIELSLFNNITSLKDSDKVLKNITGHNPNHNDSYVSGWSVNNKNKNPCDYVLMIEGMMLFAGSISKRQSKNSTSKTSFPFTVSKSHMLGDINEDNRGVILSPIWNNYITYKELEYMFTEGRLQFGDGKHTNNDIESDKAITSLGVDISISQFKKTYIQNRKGDAYLYIDGDPINVQFNPNVNLLNDLDVWYNIEKKESNTFKHIIYEYNNTISQFCNKKIELIDILPIIGKLERHIALFESDIPPLKLKSNWFESCYDGTSEFRIASSIASIGDKNNMSIRENLEPIQYDKKWKFTKDFTSYVWKEEDNLLNNLSRVLYRRALDGKINSCDSLPIKGSIYAKISDIVKFLNGELDMKKIADLILPLSIILEDYKKYPPWYNDPKINYMPLPEVYSILKLIHPPSYNENIPFDNSIISLLDAQKLSQAYLNTSNILATHGLTPKTYQKNIVMPEQLNFSKSLEKHIMASLLFPISEQDRCKIIQDYCIINE